MALFNILLIITNSRRLAVNNLSTIKYRLFIWVHLPNCDSESPARANLGAKSAPEVPFWAVILFIRDNLSSSRISVICGKVTVYSFKPKIVEKNFWQTPKRAIMARKEAKDCLISVKTPIVTAAWNLQLTITEMHPSHIFVHGLWERHKHFTTMVLF